MSYLERKFSNEGRVAMVTGSGSGMGMAFAKALAKSGAKVICAARRLDKVQAVADEINADGGQAAAVSLDIGDTGSVKSAFDQAEKLFGPVDILVNNAGQIQFKPFAGRRGMAEPDQRQSDRKHAHVARVLAASDRQGHARQYR